ncbi:MAG: hypothetical protein WA734_19010 [Candidatus Acidiferrales bacterium]
MITIWHSTWSEKERQLKAEIERGDHADLLPELMSKLDNIILRQAETLGWRLLISTRVLNRISLWDAEVNGSDLFMRLGKALAKYVKIVQRKELPPVDDPDVISAQTQTVRELRYVLRGIKQEYSGRHSSPNARQLLESFVRIVSDLRENLPSLKANLLRWVWFFDENPSILKAHIIRTRLSPSVLFLEWYSACKGHEPETLRKKISSMRRLKANR